MTVDEIIEKALQEDIGDGDHTSLSTIPTGAKGKARLLIKQPGVLAGLEVAEKVFKKVDNKILFKSSFEDGDPVIVGDVVFTLEGPSRSILIAERLALNFLQRLSGIATYTSKVVEKIKGTRAKILDTRKTTPNLRQLEKAAVLAGGGHNHRFGLYDMILIKDNHIDYAGGITNALMAVKKYLDQTGKKLPVELEVRSTEELTEAVSIGGFDRILLDNFSPQDMQTAIAFIDGQYETEASGGINLDNIREYAETGVNFISVGALTHQIQSLDMSLIAD